MRVALDTNVLVYAEGANGVAMRDEALRLIERLPASAVVLPVQALGELFNVLVKKAKRPPARARAALLSWRDAYPVIDTSVTVMVNATDLAADHRLSIWDSVVVAASAEAGCRLLLSEGLQDGFTWRGVTVVNPSAPALHPLLGSLLSPPGENQLKARPGRQPTSTDGTAARPFSLACAASAVVRSSGSAAVTQASTCSARATRRSSPMA
jgi:predicted nucleic acid-binding protein